MANPSWVTEENIRFDGTVQNAVVLDATDDIRSLILWDDLSVGDQTLLTNAVTQLGGETPIGDPIAGYTTVNYSSTITGASATGLSAAVSTAGQVVINVGGNKTTSDASGIPNPDTSQGTPATAGTNTVTFTGAFQSSDNVPYIPLTAGTQTITFNAPVTTDLATGLSDSATTYGAIFTVDGGSPIHFTATGDTITTFGDLQTALTTAIGSVATVSFVDSQIVIASNTSGMSSTVFISADDVFNLLTGYVSLDSAVGGSGIINLVATVTIDDLSPVVITVTRDNAATFSTLAAAFQTAIGETGTVSFTTLQNSTSTMVIQSATTGATSLVVIADTNLFSAISVDTAFNEVDGVDLVPPSDAGKGPVFYRAVIVIDNEQSFNVSNTGFIDATFQDILDQINGQIGDLGTASIVDGNLVIVSSSTGYKSSVKILDSGFFFSKLTDYAGIDATQGTSVDKFHLSLFADNTQFDVFVDGSAVQTYTLLLAAINTVITSKATALISNGNILITSKTLGPASMVTVVTDTLFPATTNFVNKQFVAGTDSMINAMRILRSPNGSSLLDHFPIVKVGVKPAVPTYTPHSIHFIYFDGTVWKYLDDDTPVDPT